MENKKEQLKFKNRTTLSYIGFVFQTFLKRPFGYIIALLYIVYLSVILLIVPSCIHVEPLFIWSNAAFNMPIFNLFFIAATAGALAVAVFRTGRDDGTELTLSSKPITKNIRVFGKVFVYIVVMLIFTAIIIGILSLIYPVFGEYDLWTNFTGIKKDKYIGLLLSMLVGNIVTMLFFGGISVLISMVGGQVITIIGSVGIAFLMCLLNVIFPIAISSPRDVLTNKYNTSINSMVCNTRGQYTKPDGKESTVKNFAAIQCITETSGEEIAHYDTYEYWTKANKESGLKATNYVDFGKQLSYTFNAFGVDEAKLLAASKLMIGANNASYYKINKDSHITDQKNKDAENYPFSIYSLTASQGVSFPTVYVMAGDLDLAGGNWFAVTTLCHADWNAAVIASTSTSSYKSTEYLRNALGRSWYRMDELQIKPDQKQQAKVMFDEMIKWPIFASEQYSNDENSSYSAINFIIENNDNKFWDGGKEEWQNLTLPFKFLISSRIQMAWLEFAQDWQLNQIAQYCEDNGIDDSFPYKSKTVKQWYEEKVVKPDGTKGDLYYEQSLIQKIYRSGIHSGKLDDNTNIYTSLPTKTLEYCETFNNLYQYNVTAFYNVNIIITIWTIISAGLFTTSIVVYKKTDFK